MRQGLTGGTRVRIISGTHQGQTGTVEAQVFQKTVDFPDELAHGYHVTLDDGTWGTVKRDQVVVIAGRSKPLSDSSGRQGC